MLRLLCSRPLAAVVLIGAGVLLSAAARGRAAAFPTNVTIMLSVAGRQMGLSNGEYVTEQGGLNQPYRYYVEVPAGYSGSLVIDIFDADCGAGGGSAARDFQHGGSFNSNFSYALTSPTGSSLSTNFSSGTPSAPSGANNAWLNFYTTNSAVPGHYIITINSSNDGDDINRFSLRAHDGNTGAGGTEFPIYAHSYFAMFVDAGESGTGSVYPWVTSDCRVRVCDFDNDSRGQLQVVSRTGAINQAFSGSGNNAWGNNLGAAHASDSAAVDYGIWTWTIAQQNQNYTTYYVGNASAANPPTTQPQANTFRVYLPTDAGTAPAKPYVVQQVTYVQGPNPPVSGQTTRVRVAINVINPTGSAITFDNAGSPNRRVTAFIPAARNAYRGVSFQQGSIVSQPSLGSTGTLTWNPGVVAAGSSAALLYDVDVTPTASNQRTAVTGSFSSNGTTARYVDETGRTAQEQANYTFGPLCELAVTSGQSVTTAVRMADARAEAYQGGVRVSWETGHEVNNLGFNVYRAEGGHRVLLNRTPIAGTALRVGPNVEVQAGQAYSWWDAEPGSQYWLEDLDLNGKRTWHGPLAVTRGGARAPAPAANSPLLGKRANGRALASDDCACTGARRRAAPAAPLAGPGWAAVAAGAGVKIWVEEEGWVKLTQPALLAAGLAPRTDPRQLGLYVDGRAVPLFVGGEKDGRLDPGDTVEFYGLGADTPVTAARVYWLVPEQKKAARLGVAPGGGPGRSAGNSFLFTSEQVERVNYFPALLNGAADNFFGPLIGPDPLERPFPVVGLAPGGAGTLEVDLQGVTSLEDLLPDHRVLVRVNGVTVGQAVFDGRTFASRSFPVPGGVLAEGANTITLAAEASPADFSLLGALRLTYPRRYVAEGDRLRFSAPVGTAFRIAGFTHPGVRLFDITEADAPFELPVSVLPGEPHEGATYAVSGRSLPTGSGLRWYLAVAAGAEQPPVRVAANQPSAWLRPQQQADLVILAPAEFGPALGPLVQHRRGQGLQVALVDVEDAWDETTYGQRSLEGLKAFLAATRSWKKAPRYVLLAGDASFDPRDYLGFGPERDRIPAPLRETAFLETASDDWYGDFDGDERPDLALGRLPAGTAGELQRLVGKTLAWETGALAQGSGWRQQALLVGDAGFGEVLAGLAGQLGGGLQSRTLLRDTHAKSELLTALNQGSYLVQYHGHGAGNLWNGNYLTSDDALGLTNGTRLPIVSSMTCFNGYFVELYYEPLAEALLKAPEGGAVAVWSSSGFCEAAPQEALSRAFLSVVGGKKKAGGLTLGEACMAAKRQVADVDVLRAWILLGDPCLKLR